MSKIHTKAKRNLRLNHNTRHIFRPKTTKRPKSFMTEKGAENHAKELGLESGKYVIVSAKKGKKYQVKAL